MWHAGCLFQLIFFAMSLVAILGGKIYSDLVKQGKEIELNDCLIAATALFSGIKEVVTKNVSRFYHYQPDSVGARNSQCLLRM